MSVKFGTGYLQLILTNQLFRDVTMRHWRVVCVCLTIKNKKFSYTYTRTQRLLLGNVLQFTFVECNLLLYIKFRGYFLMNYVTQGEF
jgi:hypothetical protein